MSPSPLPLPPPAAPGAGIGEQEAEARPGRDEAEPAARRLRQLGGAGLAGVQGAPGAAQRLLRGAGRAQGGGADPALAAGQPEGGNAPQGSARRLSACGARRRRRARRSMVLLLFLEVGYKRDLSPLACVHLHTSVLSLLVYFHLLCSVATVSQRVKKLKLVALFITLRSKRRQNILLCFTLLFISVLCLIYCLHLLPRTHVVPQDEKVQLKDMRHLACSLLTQVCVWSWDVTPPSPSCKNNFCTLFFAQQPFFEDQFYSNLIESLSVVKLN